MKVLTPRQQLAAMALGGLLANPTIISELRNRNLSEDDFNDWYIRAAFRGADRILAEPIKARAVKKRK